MGSEKNLNEVCKHGGLKRRCDSCYAIEAEAEIERLKAEVERLQDYHITVGTPHAVCDGNVSGTIASIEKKYGKEAKGWTYDWADEIKTLEDAYERLKAQLSRLGEDRRVLLKEAHCRRAQASAAIRLQEFDQYATLSEKEGNYRSVLLDEWSKARDEHSRAMEETNTSGALWRDMKATDAAKAMEGL